MTAGTVKAAVGREFEIRLDATATTGYVWRVPALPVGIALVDSGYEQPRGEAAPGSPTPQFFRFRALQPGDYEIRFELKRQWESAARESRSVKVEVR